MCIKNFSLMVHNSFEDPRHGDISPRPEILVDSCELQAEKNGQETVSHVVYR